MKSRKFLLGLFLGIISSIFLFLGIVAFYKKSLTSKDMLAKIRKTLPDAELPLVDTSCYPFFFEDIILWSEKGKAIRLSDIHDKVIFLNFWRTTCIPCRAELETISELYQKVKDRNIVFLIVSSESSQAVNEYLRNHNLSLPTYNVAKEDFSRSIYYSRSVPVTFILTKDHKLILKERKASNWNTLEMLNFLERFI